MDMSHPIYFCFILIYYTDYVVAFKKGFGCQISITLQVNHRSKGNNSQRNVQLIAIISLYMVYKSLSSYISQMDQRI